MVFDIGFEVFLEIFVHFWNNFFTERNKINKYLAVKLLLPHSPGCYKQLKKAVKTKAVKTNLKMQGEKKRRKKIKILWGIFRRTSWPFSPHYSLYQILHLSLYIASISVPTVVFELCTLKMWLSQRY